MNIGKMVFIVITSFLLITACATPYQPNSFGGGYSNVQLNEDMYKVSFRGNGYTSDEKVQNYLLRRCAQLTLEHGYKYFAILGSGVSDDVGAFSTPTTVRTTGFGSFNGGGNAATNYYSGYAYTNYNSNGFSNYNVNTTINPGQTFVFHKYRNTAIIKMLKSNKKIPTAFNAELLMQSTQG